MISKRVIIVLNQTELRLRPSNNRRMCRLRVWSVDNKNSLWWEMNGSTHREPTTTKNFRRTIYRLPALSSTSSSSSSSLSSMSLTTLPFVDRLSVEIDELGLFSQEKALQPLMAILTLTLAGSGWSAVVRAPSILPIRRPRVWMVPCACLSSPSSLLS